MNFRDIDIKKEYRSLLDNVAKDFYIPLLSRATLSDEGDKENEIIDGLTKDVSSQGVLKIINEKLTQREKEVILLRYGFVDDVAHTLDSIAGKYGLTRERVRQIESKALRKISRYIN